ncbi:hypothetical protein L6452_33937 [Arctium lappa]|uniref:Uncharacterized protein n=1 Tax=Arctium lappa TaxID=4217 RepID=A0ACB8YG71_ARCLA|nr:hypothetical protein L6452_33937 [Arctium lappa]
MENFAGSNSTLVSKVPMLKPNEFDMWKIRIRQYILLTDYSMWDVIENGPSTEGQIGPDGKRPPPKTDVKRFVGTKSIKRNQRDVLKQQFNKLIGELPTVGVKMEQDDINRKFLRSLGNEWTMYTVSYRQSDNLEEKELADLYNDLRVFESEVEAKKKPTENIHNAALLSAVSAASGVNSE